MNCRLIFGLSVVLASFGCVPETETPADAETSTETGEPGTGDGDGDPATGDGDGDPSGDGDGDGTTSGDGDGDPTTSGDGDGDPTTSGDGDGEPQPEPDLELFFVGNSYTAFNNLPQLVVEIAAGADLFFTANAVTPGGAWVEDHLMNPTVLEGLGQPYDAIVLQGQSVQPVIATVEFQAAVVAFSELMAMGGDGRLVLYQTWPRAETSEVLDQLGMSQLEMYEALANGYQGAADLAGAEVGRVGDAWMDALALEPPIELYTGDGSHPSFAGSYLAACVLFGQLADTPCGESAYAPDNLSEEDRTRLQAMADMTNGFVDP